MAKRKSAEEWKEAIATYKSSGLTAQEWCKENQISLNTFRSWLYSKGKNPSKSSDICWAELKISEQQASENKRSNFITIRYESFAIDVFENTDSQILAEVLKTLREI